MSTFAEAIAARLQLHVEAARDAYGQAWADAAQAVNPAPTYPIRYEPGYVVVPLIPWFLSHGTIPHDIPGAFGYPLPFGMTGRFGGMFHPGTKPTHFIERARQAPDVQETLARFPGLLFGKG